ncbi:MAG TPA: TIM barrel protein [Armatimonadota bacterium]|mgnify:CR=1 FL=1|nr:TIM barrel protein [Armatimonadota bacterium]
MEPIRQCASWGCFCRDGVTPQQLVTEAAKIGYAALEMPPTEHYDLIREHGLLIGTIVGHASLADGLNKRENHDRIEGEILANLDVAVRYGIPNLIVLSGNREGKSEIEGAENTIAILSRVAKPAEEKGVNLVLELLNSKVDHHDYQCDSTSWGAHVVRMVGSPRVKLLYDIYHMQIMEGDIIRTIRDHIDLIGHFHTAGNPGRRDLDDAQEINYRAVARAIAETGYRGLVGHELIPKGDPLECLRASFEVFRVA